MSVLGSILTCRAELPVIFDIVKVLGRDLSACDHYIRELIGE